MPGTTVICARTRDLVLYDHGTAAVVLAQSLYQTGAVKSNIQRRVMSPVYRIGDTNRKYKVPLCRTTASSEPDIHFSIAGAAAQMMTVSTAVTVRMLIQEKEHVKADLSLYREMSIMLLPTACSSPAQRL